MAKHALGALAIAFVVLLSSAALADGRVQFLAERLKYPPASGQADDFRVRTNAALALGLTNDDQAVAPLCAGLSDPSDAVRQGSAVALRRRARSSSLDCLRARASVETSQPVAAQLRRTIDALESNAGGGGDGAHDTASVANARFYVALSHVTNHTARARSEVEQVVRDAIVAQLGKTGDFQFAPEEETSSAAKSAVTALHLKGYFLAISVEKFDYSSDGLRVRVKITVFSYPGKDLRGEVPAAATLPGAKPGDTDSENQLMGVVAARAAELFAQSFK